MQELADQSNPGIQFTTLQVSAGKDWDGFFLYIPHNILYCLAGEQKEVREAIICWFLKREKLIHF